MNLNIFFIFNGYYHQKIPVQGNNNNNNNNNKTIKRKTSQAGNMPDTFP